MKIFSSLLLIFSTGLVMAQEPVVKEIKRINTFSEAFAPLRFLASDELMGRGTYRSEIHIAARYIAEYFRSLGLKEVPGTSDYFQNFSIKLESPPTTGSLTAGTQKWDLGGEIVKTNSGDNALTGTLIYVGHGTEAELAKVDVRGKIVVSDFGINDSTSIRDGIAYFQSGEKQALMKEKGALASIERFKTSARYPWAAIAKYFSREHPQTEEADPFGIYLIQDEKSSLKDLITGSSLMGTLNATGGKEKKVPAQNVMAWVEGTDKALKGQFVLLSFQAATIIPSIKAYSHPPIVTI